MDVRFVRIAEACKILAISRSTLYNKIKNDPQFPKLVKHLGNGTKASSLVSTEIAEYLNARIRERDGSAA